MNGLSKLNTEDKKLSESFSTCGKCKDALSYLEKGKLLGLDDLPSELDQCFREQRSLFFFFYKALKDIFDKGKISYTQRFSIISLTYKKKKNESKNYRTISLINLCFVFTKTSEYTV